MSELEYPAALDALDGVADPPAAPPASETRDALHAIYRRTFPYPGRKAANVVNFYVRHFAPEPGALVADPYAGGGTTVGEALRLRRRIISLDVQPLSELINKSLMAPVGPLSVSAAVDRVRGRVRRLFARLGPSVEANGSEQVRDLFDLDFLDRPLPHSIGRPGVRTYADAFTADHLLGLLATRSALEEEQDDGVRDVLWLAFANMIKYAHRGYQAKKNPRTGAIERWRGDTVLFKYGRLGNADRFTHIPFDDVFEHCVQRVEELKRATAVEFGEYPRPGETAWFFRDSATRLSERVAEAVGGEPLDYVLTDPPYSSLVRYNDVLSFWNIWLPGGVLPLGVALDDVPDAGGPTMFRERLTASIREIASVLKEGGWLTLMYLDIADFTLWHQIIEEAADARLEHVNSNWVTQQIPSRTQTLNPLSAVRGAVAANFRRTRARIRPVAQARPAVRPIRTPLAYLELQLQRVLVQNLGATTSEIMEHLSDELYTRRALETLTGGGTESVPALLEQLGATHLAPLVAGPQNGSRVWILSDQVALDPELDAYDRLRYQLFRLLATQQHATTTELARHVFTEMGGVGVGEVRNATLLGILSTFAEPSPGRAEWEIDWQGRNRSAQLRLLLSRSSALTMREYFAGESTSLAEPGRVSAVQSDGLARLAALAPDGATSRAWLQISRALHLLLTVLRDESAGLVSEIWAVHDTVEAAWDSEDPRYDDLPLLVILSEGITTSPEVEATLLEGVFARLYQQTRLNFVPYIRSASDEDLDAVFGTPAERVLLLSSRPRFDRVGTEQIA